MLVLSCCVSLSVTGTTVLPRVGKVEGLFERTPASHVMLILHRPTNHPTVSMANLACLQLLLHYPPGSAPFCNESPLSVGQDEVDDPGDSNSAVNHVPEMHFVDCCKADVTVPVKEKGSPLSWTFCTCVS